MSVLKKHKIVCLPTNQKTIGTLALAEVENNRDNRMLCLVKEFDNAPLGEIFIDKINNNQHFVGNVISFNHLYFLSDDEIKEGDWVMQNETRSIAQYKGHGSMEHWSKIIATTNLSLKQDLEYVNGVKVGEVCLPQPLVQFIEKYIELYNQGKAPSEILV